MRKTLTRAILAGSLSVAAMYAASVTSGSTVAATSAAVDPLSTSGFTTVANTGLQNFTFMNANGNPLSASGQEWVVVDNGQDNPNGAGYLDFVIRVRDTTQNPTAQYPGILERITAASFYGFTTSLDYFDTTNVPSGFTQSANPTTEGRQSDVVNFQFNTPISPNQATPYLIIETNAKYFVPGTFTAQDGVAATLTGFAPTSAPEPVSMSLLGGGLALVGIARWRRKAAK
jgi:hypothetical protein